MLSASKYLLGWSFFSFSEKCIYSYYKNNSHPQIKCQYKNQNQNQNQSPKYKSKFSTFYLP